MLAIIDYGAGNLNSIQKALTYLGEETEVIAKGDEAKPADYQAVILPGVGAFPEAMQKLKSSKFIKFIDEFVATGKPFLGICLGMQLLFECGYEVEKTAGLGLLKGEITKMTTKYKIPHMGWNQLQIRKSDSLFKGLPAEPHFYFVHSYQLAELSPDVLAIADYGGQVPAVVKKDNIIGFQFHPEKSGDNGIKLLANFKELLR